METISNHKVLGGAKRQSRAQSSKFKVQSVGRAELAQHYFPFIQPQSAWQKLKSLLQEDPDLQHLTQLKRRTFLPAEVAKIYALLGHP